MRAVRTRTGSPARDCPRVAERSAEEAGFEEQPLTQDPEHPHAVASVERPGRHRHLWLRRLRQPDLAHRGRL